MNKVKLIKTTFAQITPESASVGDFSETGWVDEDGEEFESVDEAIRWLKRQGITEASDSDFRSGIWYSTDFSTIDYEDGTEEQNSFHLEGFTEEEEKKIFKALKF